MDLEQYFAVPANRERVLSIVSRVLLALEPSGAELELGHLEPLIDLAVKDEVIVADRWDVAGRFGNADLLGPLIVPLVVQAVRRSGEGAAAVTLEEVKSMVRRTRSPRGLRMFREIEQATNKALESFGEARHAV